MPRCKTKFYTLVLSPVGEYFYWYWVAFQYILVGTGCGVGMLLQDFELDFAWYIFNYLNIKLAEIAFKHSDINKTPAPIGGKKGNICPCWGQVVWG